MALHMKGSRWQTFPVKTELTGVWKNITKVVKELEADNIFLADHMSKQVGCWDKTSFWHEEWTGSGILKDVFPLLFKIEKEKNCTVLDRLDTSNHNPSCKWNWKKTRLSAEEDIESLCCELIIQDTRLPNTVDTWVWKTDAEGEFSVRSIRRLWESAKYQELDYKHWWNKWVPLKVNFLCWRAVLNRLPSKLELEKRQVSIPSIDCAICNMAEESCEHSFYVHGQPRYGHFSRIGAV
ncbi:hypothetical protein LXL04_007264 [Taraxacum kok-saghyz]